MINRILLNLSWLLSNTFRHFLLRKLINDRDIASITELLKSNFDLNTSVCDNDTHLIAAIRTRSYEIVKLLLDNGANVNQANSMNMYPLHVALYYCKTTEIIELLLKNGADVNADTEISAVEIAVKCVRYPNACRLLLDYGADIKDFNKVLLEWREINYRYKWNIIEVLANYGADLKCATKHMCPATYKISALVIMKHMSYDEMGLYLSRYEPHKYRIHAHNYCPEIRKKRWEYWRPLLVFMYRRNVCSCVIGKQIKDYL